MKLLGLAGLLLSAVSARRVPDSVSRTPGVTWLNDDRTAMVRLDAPGLPLLTWNHLTKEATQVAQSSAVVLNFTMSRDNLTLLLQGEPFFPLPDPNVPARIWAKPIPMHVGPREYNQMVQNGYFDANSKEESRWISAGLSYDRVFNPRDNATNAPHTALHMLNLDIIGATFPPNMVTSKASELTLLDVKDQKEILLYLVRQKEDRIFTPDNGWEIRRIAVRKRPTGFVPAVPHTPGECTLRSWRCADLDGSPYYRYVWFHEFDEYGRIGSLRHILHQALGAIASLFSNIYAIIIAASLGGVALMSILVGAYRMLTKRSEYRLLPTNGDNAKLLECDHEDPEMQDHVGSSKFYDTNPHEVERTSNRPGTPPPNYENLNKPLPQQPSTNSEK